MAGPVGQCYTPCAVTPRLDAFDQGDRPPKQGPDRAALPVSRRAVFRFYAELNDFLPPARRMVAFAHHFSGQPAIKDVIEALGVPHTEVDLILVNGESVGFEYRLQDGDRVAVYPMFETLDIGPVARLRPEPLRDPRFVLDAHLGRLAGYLRLLGFDSLYRADYHDAELARISCRERRILLTRDRALLKRSEVSHGYWVRETDPLAQLREVVVRFDLRRIVRPFSRCMRCNGPLLDVAKAEIADQLYERTRQEHDRFRRCASCGRIYWRGSHYERLCRLLANLEPDDARAAISRSAPTELDEG